LVLQAFVGRWSKPADKLVVAGMVAEHGLVEYSHLLSFVMYGQQWPSIHIHT
jgi:hypothetical protein